MQRCVQEFVIMGRIAFERMAQNTSAHSKIFLPLGITDNKRGRVWAEYLIITKVILVSPYASHESFFHQEQKHNILNFIRCILRGLCTPWILFNRGICPC
jgi:hypothetical protein